MKEERAIFAGGCFWGMQDLIRPLPSANQWQFKLHSLWLDDERQWQRHRSGEKGYCTTAELHYFVVRT